MRFRVGIRQNQDSACTLWVEEKNSRYVIFGQVQEQKISCHKGLEHKIYVMCSYFKNISDIAKTAVGFNT
jgi:hypothetical protein